MVHVKSPQRLHMKTKLRIGFLALAATVCFAWVLTAWGQSKANAPAPESRTARVLALELGRKLPLAVRSHPVEWRTNTYHLVSLGTIQFELDPATGRLKAEIFGSVTTFDNVKYDVSAAVFDAQGTLLGTARTECAVERTWLGKVLTMQQTLTLDFGESLDYAKATGFMVNISRRAVVTPDAWQK